MSIQRSIRFPDEIAHTIQAEAARLNLPFAWVVIDACRRAHAHQPNALTQAHRPAEPGDTAQRGSPSPSLARFNPGTQGG